MVRIAWLSAAVRDDDVGPDAVEDVAAVNRLASLLDQEHEEIEIAGDERQLVSVAEEQPLSR